MKSNIRLNCNRIKDVGRPTIDWSNQTKRFDRIRKGSTLRNQFITDPSLENFHCFTEVSGIRTFNRTIKDKNGTHVISEVIGNATVVLKGTKVTMKVKKSGFAYSLVQNGVTPGRWVFYKG